MTPDIRLYVVTDNPQLAAVELFAVDLPFVPAWVKMVTAHTDLMAIPTGARVMPSWHGRRSLLEDLWTEERVTRRFRDGWDENRAEIAGWRARRHAHFLATCCDQTGTPVAEVSSRPAAPPAVGESASPSAGQIPAPGKTPAPRKTRWT